MDLFTGARQPWQEACSPVLSPEARAFSPAEIDAGPVYEFNIYHLMEIDDAEAFGRTEWLS